MRHGVAVPARQFPKSDFERPLSPQGQAQVIRLAQHLSSWDLPVSTLYHSPMRRAQQTATILADNLKLSTETWTELAEEDDPAEFHIFVQAHDFPTIFLIGHQPLLERYTNFLLGVRGIGISLVEAGLVLLEGRAGPGDFQLLGLYRPDQLLAPDRE